MNMHVQDPFEAAARRGGYTAEFLAKINAKRKAEEAERAAEAAAVQREQDRKRAMDVLWERGAPRWVRELVLQVCDERDVSVAVVVGPCRSVIVSRVRYEAYHRIKEHRPTLSTLTLGRWFDRDHTAILYGLAIHADLTGKPSFSAYSLEKKMARVRAAEERRRAKARARSGEKAVSA